MLRMAVVDPIKPILLLTRVTLVKLIVPDVAVANSVSFDEE